MRPECSACKGTSQQVRECLEGFEPAPRYIRRDGSYSFSEVQVIVAAPDTIITEDQKDAFLDAIADHLPGCGWIGADGAKGRFVVKVVPKEAIP